MSRFTSGFTVLCYNKGNGKGTKLLIPSGNLAPLNWVQETMSAQKLANPKVSGAPCLAPWVKP